MGKPVWVELAAVYAIHDEQLAEHGGMAGVRDRGLLESALARPRNQYHYKKRPVTALSASYAFGLARNHPFVDGNKRTSLIVTELFLALNGIELIAPDDATVMTWLQLASGEISEEALVDWIAASGPAYGR